MLIRLTSCLSGPLPLHPPNAKEFQTSRSSLVPGGTWAVSSAPPALSWQTHGPRAAATSDASRLWFGRRTPRATRYRPPVCGPLRSYRRRGAQSDQRTSHIRRTSILETRPSQSHAHRLRAALAVDSVTGVAAIAHPHPPNRGCPNTSDSPRGAPL